MSSESDNLWASVDFALSLARALHETGGVIPPIAELRAMTFEQMATRLAPKGIRFEFYPTKAVR